MFLYSQSESESLILIIILIIISEISSKYFYESKVSLTQTDDCQISFPLMLGRWS